MLKDESLMAFFEKEYSAWETLADVMASNPPPKAATGGMQQAGAPWGLTRLNLHQFPPFFFVPLGGADDLAH